MSCGGGGVVRMCFIKLNVKFTKSFSSFLIMNVQLLKLS